MLQPGNLQSFQNLDEFPIAGLLQMRSEVTIAQLSGQMSCSQNFSERFAVWIPNGEKRSRLLQHSGKLPWINCKACNAVLRPGVLDVMIYRAEMGQKDHKTQQLEIEQQRVDLRFAVIQKLCLQKLDDGFRNWTPYSETTAWYSEATPSYSETTRIQKLSETFRNYFGVYRNYSVVFRNYRLGLGSL